MQMTSLRSDITAVPVRRSHPQVSARGCSGSNHKAERVRAPECGAYGAQMAAYMRLPYEPMFRVTPRRICKLAVTRLSSNDSLPEMSIPTPPEEAFIVELHLRSASPVFLWQRGRPVNVDQNRCEGAVCIVNLEDEPSVYFGSAFDLLHVYVPHASLCEFADEHGARRCESLNWPFGKVDPILKNLGVSLLQAMESPELAGSLYLDHAVLAIHAYIACTYGGMRIEPYAMRGGLTRRQMQRATEILTANLDGHVSLSQVARECQLSVSHFVRAFKQSVGQTPYRWLMERRIEAAKDLLLNSRLTQADIALRCGFADQACFIRCFRCKVNATPGEWRRTLAD
jgi:AraC family transcriptional regulator